MRLNAIAYGIMIGAASLLITEASFAQESRDSNTGSSRAQTPTYRYEPLSLRQDEGDDMTDDTTTREYRETTTETSTMSLQSDYLGVNDFFNIREANADVRCGQWMFQAATGWSTSSDGTDDDIDASADIAYGITDNLFVRLKVLPIALGDGGDHGAGDLGLQLFYQCLEESGDCPSIGSWIEMRIPSGDGSSGVDASLHTTITKTIAPKFRMHFQGFVQTANGARGGMEEENRRHFQWGLGPGVDYEFNECWLGVLNYLHRSSNEYGKSNQHIIEAGSVFKLVENQSLKVAVDVDVCNDGDDSPNVGAKVQYAITF